MADTAKASWITDHAFVPRADNPYLCGYEEHHVRSSDNKICNMAEAAHRETTVRR